jgi:hypothetical protein
VGRQGGRPLLTASPRKVRLGRRAFDAGARARAGSAGGGKGGDREGDNSAGPSTHWSRLADVRAGGTGASGRPWAAGRLDVPARGGASAAAPPLGLQGDARVRCRVRGAGKCAAPPRAGTAESPAGAARAVRSQRNRHRRRRVNSTARVGQRRRGPIENWCAGGGHFLPHPAPPAGLAPLGSRPSCGDSHRHGAGPHQR